MRCASRNSDSHPASHAFSNFVSAASSCSACSPPSPQGRVIRCSCAKSFPEIYGAGAPDFFLAPSTKRERSAARRYQSVLRLATRVSSAKTRRLAALHLRRLFTPGPRFLHTGGSLFASLSGNFRFPRPAQSSHRRQPHVVGADGDPGRPGAHACETQAAGAASCPAITTPRDDASSGQDHVNKILDYGDVRAARNSRFTQDLRSIFGERTASEADVVLRQRAGNADRKAVSREQAPASTTKHDHYLRPVDLGACCNGPIFGGGTDREESYRELSCRTLHCARQTIRTLTDDPTHAGMCFPARIRHRWLMRWRPRNGPRDLICAAF